MIEALLGIVILGAAVVIAYAVLRLSGDGRGRDGLCFRRARVHVRTEERSRGMKAPPRRLTGDGHRVAPHLTAPAPTAIRL